MPRRPPWQFVVAAILLVLLGILGTLQYRWLGAVSDAERDRMQAGLRARTSDFARDFDGELARVYAAFSVDSDAVDRDAAGTLADAYHGWRSSAAVPDLVRALLLIEQPGDSKSPTLSRLNVNR